MQAAIFATLKLRKGDDAEGEKASAVASEVAASGDLAEPTPEVATDSEEPADKEVTDTEAAAAEAAEAAAAEAAAVEAAAAEAAAAAEPTELEPVEKIEAAPRAAVATAEPRSKRSRARRQPTRRANKPKRAETSRATTVREPTPVPEPPAPKPAIETRAEFLTVPAGATLALDGVFIGRSPMRQVDLAPGRHRLAVSLSGYDPQVIDFRASEGRTERVRIKLDKTRVVVASKVKKPIAAKVEEPKAPSKPRTPRVGSTRDGDASRGRGVLGSKCNRCHSERGVRRVSAGKYTRAQWNRFFASGSHDRYERLGGVVSSGQLAHVKAYLKTRAADVPKHQGAGIRD